jgi:hypothetical protein
MPNWLKGALIALASVAATLAIVQMMRSPVEGRAPDANVLRTADGKPDINGIWQAVGSANWSLLDHQARGGPVLELGAVGAVPAGLSVVEGNEIPYQSWAAAKQKENYENWLSRDPEVKCYLPGIPRATYMPYPFQIVQGETDILFLYEYAGANRAVHMINHTESPIDSWMGWSNGRWDGDTLLIEVKGFTDASWFDRAGNHHSDALTVTERYTLGAGGNHLNYEARIEDPKTFIRPWTIRMPLYRRLDANVQLLPYNCVEFSEELLYGDVKRKPSK